MQTRIDLTKNLFETVQATESDRETPDGVFISYKRDPDKDMAYRCAEILQETCGLYYWIDEEHAEAKGSDLQIARCIEEGLDATSALLGIIGSQTFESAWIPYEIGGARGRHQNRERFDRGPLPEDPHPLIAHLIYESTDPLPGFIRLGVPLRCLCEVEQWAAYIADVLQRELVLPDDFRSIQEDHGIEKIYESNIGLLTWM